MQVALGGCVLGSVQSPLTDPAVSDWTGSLRVGDFLSPLGHVIDIHSRG